MERNAETLVAVHTHTHTGILENKIKKYIDNKKHNKTILNNV